MQHDRSYILILEFTRFEQTFQVGVRCTNSGQVLHVTCSAITVLTSTQAVAVMKQEMEEALAAGAAAPFHFSFIGVEAYVV